MSQVPTLPEAMLSRAAHGLATLGFAPPPELLAAIEARCAAEAGTMHVAGAQSLLWSLCVLHSAHTPAAAALAARLASAPPWMFYSNQLAAIFQSHLWLSTHPDSALRCGPGVLPLQLFVICYMPLSNGIEANVTYSSCTNDKLTTRSGNLQSHRGLAISKAAR